MLYYNYFLVLGLQFFEAGAALLGRYSEKCWQKCEVKLICPISKKLEEQSKAFLPFC